MGGSNNSENLLAQITPNPSEHVFPEDDLIRNLRTLEPDPIIQRFICPIWKIVGSQSDYLQAEKENDLRLEKIRVEIHHLTIFPFNESLEKVQSILKEVAKKTQSANHRIGTQQNYLKKLAQRAEFTKKLYRARLKYFIEECVTNEEDLLSQTVPNVPGQPDNPLIVYSLRSDVHHMLQALYLLFSFQQHFQDGFTKSWCQLNRWEKNFKHRTEDTQMIYEMYIANLSGKEAGTERLRELRRQYMRIYKFDGP